MKKILTLLVIMFSVSLIAQNSAVFKPNESSKKKGVFKFEIPKNISNEKFDDAKSYYTDFFEVKKDGNIINIKMIENTKEYRMIMMRFFSVLRQNEFVVGKEKYNLDLFFKEFIL